MKFFIVTALLVGLSAAAETGGTDIEACYNSAVNECKLNGKLEKIDCKSNFGGFKHGESDLRSFANSQLASSYDYLLLATHFNSYQKNRPGFSKLFNELSDKAWENTVKVIKHITKRGGVADFNKKHEIPSTVSINKRPLEVDELHAMSLALDSEKKLANEAMRLHHRVSHLDSNAHFDAEIGHFIEEKFLTEQAGTVRKLAGYANDLAKLMNTPEPSLALYMFDEYLK